MASTLRLESRATYRTAALARLEIFWDRRLGTMICGAPASFARDRREGRHPCSDAFF
jgi:hypothetical protein